jgi:hypothetical protein
MNSTFLVRTELCGASRVRRSSLLFELRSRIHMYIVRLSLFYLAQRLEEAFETDGQTNTLIPNFRRILNAVCFPLGDSPASVV